MALKQLSDTLLKEAYEKAKEHELKEDFIEILKNELIRRNVDFSDDGR